MNKKYIWLALFLPALCQAQIYKWKDSDGTIRYTDAPPPASAQKMTTDIAHGQGNVESAEVKKIRLERAALKRETDARINVLKTRLQEAEDREAEQKQAQRDEDCKKREALKWMDRGKVLPPLLSKTYPERWQVLNISGHSVATKTRIYPPVCGNQTRYTLLTNLDDSVINISSEIVRD